MAKRIALAGLVLIAGLALLHLSGGERRSGAGRAGTAADTESARPAAPLAEPASVPEPESALVRREAADAESQRTEPALLPAGLQRVHGVVRRSSNRQPAAGAVLIFWQGDHSEEVVTDEEGRFTTDSGFASGPLDFWHRGNAPDPDWTERCELSPAQIVLPEPDVAGTAAPVELVLMEPAAWIEVAVVSPSGNPTRAMIHWTFRPPGRVGLGNSGLTGEDGRARLPFPSVAAGAELHLIARADEDVSAWARVDAPPTEEPVELVLERGGALVARVLEADGRPRAGQELRLDTEDRERPFALGSLATDAGGEARIAGLPPGPLHVRLYGPEGPEEVGTIVTIERGVRVDVELRVPHEPLAAAGAVLDAEGQPLAGVQIDARIGARRTTATSDAEGRFALRSAERGPVRLAPDLYLQADRFEPRGLEVPFGTPDVVFRQLAVRPPARLELEVVDRASGAAIPRGLALGYVDPERSSWSFHRITDGRVTVELRPYDDVGLAIGAVGYRRKTIRPTEFLSEMEPGTPVRLALEPGLEHWLRVLREADEQPLLDARILDGERLLATTDGDGRARIELATWPTELRVLATGNAERVWTCADWLAELDEGTVWLPVAAPDASDR